MASSLAEKVTSWAWWSSPDWGEYCEAYGSAAGRPVHGPSYVVDLSQDPWKALSKGHRSAVKVQRERQHIRRTISTDAFHRAHTSAAGRETRSQTTWEIMDGWLRECHGVCLSNGEGGWVYAIVDPPGAYYASSAGKDCHWLLYKLIEGLKYADFEWFELGEGHTKGIGTYKAGFSSCVVDP